MSTKPATEQQLEKEINAARKVLTSQEFEIVFPIVNTLGEKTAEARANLSETHSCVDSPRLPCHACLSKHADEYSAAK